MTEDFEKPEWESEPAEPEAELPSPFDELGAPPPEDIEASAVEKPIAPPPLPEDVIAELLPESEPVAPPLPEAYTATEVLGAPPPIPVPEPGPVAPPPHQPLTFGPPPVAAAPPPIAAAPLPIAPTPYTVDVSPAEQAAPKKSNQTLIIVLVVVGVLLLLCCCCVAAIVVGGPVLEEIMYELGLNLLRLL